MADWSMEPPAASVLPCGFQAMANWRTMDQPTAVWAPDVPMAPVSTEIFGSCPQITSVPSLARGGQLFEYAATQGMFEVDSVHYTQMTTIHTNRSPIRVFEENAHEFKVDMDMMKLRMHRYPPSVRALGESHTVPRLVSIGPYHHGRDQLKKAEKAKHVAAYNCIRESGRSVQEMYDAVVSVAYDIRRLYDDDVMAGIGDDDFLPMMFYDACFLVQYLLMRTGGSKQKMDSSLRSFFDFNSKAIHRDVMLLENQLPWRVVRTVMSFIRPVPLEKLIATWRHYLRDRKIAEQKPASTSLALDDDDSYEPPHLLALFRYHVVGSSNITKLPSVGKNVGSISISVSAIELAQIGITLKANETTDLAHMGLSKRSGAFFTELSLAPLSLTDGRASRLINMAALELCTTSMFRQAKAEDSAVCSYLRLLAMLVNREDDVHELRTKGILQGGSGLTNKEALDFFTGLQSRLPYGPCYVRTMVQIENYKVKRRMRIKVYAFVYRNIKIIVTVITATAALVGIFGTLLSLKARLH